MVAITGMPEGIGIHLPIRDIDGDPAIGAATITTEKNGSAGAGEEDNSKQLTLANHKGFIFKSKQSIEKPAVTVGFLYLILLLNVGVVLKPDKQQ